MALPSTAEKIWYNGELIPFGDAKVHVLTHAIHYGSSVFEGVRAYDTPDKGTCIFRLDEHTRRLFDSAKIYRMTIPYTQEEMNQAQKDIIVANGFKSAYLRPAAFYGEIGLGLAVPFGTEADVIVAAMQWGSYLGEEALENGVDAGIVSWNRLAANTMPTGAKAGGNYLSEGAGENIFVIRDGVVTTTPVTAAILPGITRDTIITLLKDKGYEVREQNIPREAMYLADEILMCGTAAEVTPVRSVDGIEVGNGKRGPITKEVQDAFFGLFNGTTEDKWGWLTPVR